MAIRTNSEKTKFAETFNDVTDWYIPINEDQETLVYPGAVFARGELGEIAATMREKILWRDSQDDKNDRDWRLDFRDGLFRIHKQPTVDGMMYIVRRISTDVPELESLGIPEDIKNYMCSPMLGNMGGLVLVCGEPGHGKSTTCASVLLSRVKTFGSFCLTVEDPPEFALHGEYESSKGRVGKLVQVPARSDSFAADLRDALRCYPSNVSGSMLLVGEVRDSIVAAQLLRASVSGQLVFATLHAGDPISALERLHTLATEAMNSKEAQNLIARSIRVVLHQRISSGALQVQSLISTSSSSNVALRIKSGNFAMLSSDMEHQKALSKSGRLTAGISK